MTLVKEKGGKSIAVYQPHKKDKVMPLLEENRVNYICESNFRASSQMEKLVKLILESMSLTNQLLEKESHQY